MKSLAARLVEELRRSDAAGASNLADEVADAAIGEDMVRLRALAERAGQIAADVTPVVDVAEAVATLLS